MVFNPAMFGVNPEQMQAAREIGLPQVCTISQIVRRKSHYYLEMDKGGEV
jgi:thiamine monophosphate synthase